METTATLSIDYAIKPTTYFGNVRSEMLSFIPARCTRILDVGCGSGEFGAALKAQRGVVVWGVEPFRSAVLQAAGKIDKVIQGSFPPDEALPKASFDCIVFNDVLEHMLDPDAALRHARTLLAPGGVVVSSIPNIRHFATAWRLLIEGEWKYRESGTLDKTHLRFFTRSSISELFQNAGFVEPSIVGINAYCAVPSIKWRLWRIYQLANTLTFGKFDDLKYLQFAVVAATAP